MPTWMFHSAIQETKNYSITPPRQHQIRKSIKTNNGSQAEQLSHTIPLLQPSTMSACHAYGFESKQNQTIIESTYQRWSRSTVMHWIPRSIPRALVRNGTQRMKEHHGWRLTSTDGGWPFLPDENDRVPSRRQFVTIEDKYPVPHPEERS